MFFFTFHFSVYVWVCVSYAYTSKQYTDIVCVHICVRTHVCPYTIINNLFFLTAIQIYWYKYTRHTHTHCIHIFSWLHTHTHTNIKSSYADIISTADLFDEWDPSTTTLMEEVCRLQDWLHWKINLVWSYSVTVSWFANPCIYIYIYICVCVCKNVFLVGPKREKSRYFKMNRSTKRLVFF